MKDMSAAFVLNFMTVTMENLMPETKEMILLSEALEIVERQLTGKTLPNEIIPIQQSPGRTVVENQVSGLDIPPFNKSAL